MEYFHIIPWPTFGLCRKPSLNCLIWLSHRNKFPSFNRDVNSVFSLSGFLKSYTATRHNDDSTGGWAMHETDLTLFILTNVNAAVALPCQGLFAECIARASASKINNKVMILRTLRKSDVAFGSDQGEPALCEQLGLSGDTCRYKTTTIWLVKAQKQRSGCEIFQT